LLRAAVPGHNLAMHLFLKKHGFRCTRVKDDSYHFTYKPAGVRA
jgi:hypothetical protein